MKKIIFSLIIINVLSLETFSQNKYWVMFKDKVGTPYSVSTPSAYLNSQSIARRTRQGIAISNSDLPVTPSYVTQIAAVPGATVLYRSKWLNGVVVKASATATAAIATFTFVNNTMPVNRYKVTLGPTVDIPGNNSITEKQVATTGYNYGMTNTQVTMLQADCMHSLGYRGQLMNIAVMDIGFYNVQNLQIFDSLRLEGRILGTRDFVNGDNQVYEDPIEGHGTMCLSTMAANMPGTMIGTAPKANYWLLKTEDGYSETISEEYNWVRAVEFADSVGVDICTTSLGYNTFDGNLNNHTYVTDLNGKIAPMSIAANMAARKGIIVLSAAGNEGSGPWHYITVPADADSIIAVGAVNSSYVKAPFSGFGPSADGRIKPDLCALGLGATVYDPNGFVNTGGNGTSFATPILAGAVACLWQYSFFTKNMQVISALKSSATNSTTPDNNVGWGVPKLCVAMGALSSVHELNGNSGEVTIYPNPFNSEIKIKLSDPCSLVNVVISDVSGKIVHSEKIENPSEMISIYQLNEVEKGMYFISISSPEFNINKKIVKQ